MDASKSSLIALPVELRRQILKYLLTPTGAGSLSNRTQCAILRANRLLHEEGTNILYTSDIRQQLPIPARRLRLPPRVVLRQLHHIHLDLIYVTRNRGECASRLRTRDFEEMLWENEKLARTLVEPDHAGVRLKRLHIELQAVNVRKAGGRAFKADRLLAEMRLVLVPLAYLPKSVNVTMGGFDTVPFVDDFNAMREELAGRGLTRTNTEAGQKVSWDYGLLRAGFTPPD
ncbi:MAG: hypothetical protein Q9159_003975 [Coniocarpon cinnabarinum]